jgi:hypothetical protein
MLNRKKQLDRLIGAIFFLLIIFCSQACDKVLNLKLTAIPQVTNEAFDQTPGMELPYDLYMPSSMLGWELTRLTKFQYDATHKIYVLDNILIDKPLVDDYGPRFKLCSINWRDQFGFGKYISDAESTFGIPPEGIVVQVEQFQAATTDLRIEYPAPTKSSDTSNASMPSRIMRVEFKLISKEPIPQALIRVTLR